ncbi:disulfide reductase [Desulfoluna limicola]|uniref:Disulfide reductase n=1 Tax=Desulfoluna limicola TaxID=2810562 RepID=A0ABM7PIB2_9BACT|nr:heterodisulfide reductase-related iron-sulfur binding cluster [Desulfoluna limicola]BCS96814.1 disulfide reductase [Desulfoluna limicola]
MSKSSNKVIPLGKRRICIYPGCSLTASSRDFADALFQMARMAGMWIEELKDWNCCGASPAHSVNPEYATLLSGRNLILAQKQGIEDLYVVCPSCYIRLKEAVHKLDNDERLRAKLFEAYGTEYTGEVKVRFFLEALQPGDEAIFKERMNRSLEGLNAVIYYGCLMSRPERVTGFELKTYESSIIKFVENTGAKVIDWGASSRCCGAHLAVSRPDLSDRLVDRILEQANRAKANCIVTFCPLCQVNLEMRGTPKNRLPVFFIPELAGFASGEVKAEKWARRHLVNPMPLLKTNRIL